jgi:4-diphosphocytidyl-2-C-methyl-D-erythritol kinase
LTIRAPAKLNLCLYLGPRRQAPTGADARRSGAEGPGPSRVSGEGEGLHEILSVFCPLTLADRIVVSDAEEDRVVCSEVVGPNLAADALRALRARGWTRPPVRVEIEKRIPAAAGLGGGSADAAAVLRMAGEEVEGLAELAGELGADVPSQLDPAFALVGGAGEIVEPLPPPRDFAVVLVPAADGLSTADVYAEADRLGLGRDTAELDAIAQDVRAVAIEGTSPLDYPELLVNDLAEAALALRPEIGTALAALEEAGATVALVTGSGPTAFGLFEHIAAADRAASELPPRYANAIVAAPEVAS